MTEQEVAAEAAAGEALFSSAFAEAAADVPETGTVAPPAEIADTSSTMPAPAAGSTETPAPVAGTPKAAAPAAADIDALLATADPAIKLAFERAKHSDQSNRNRVSALQRQINELKATGKPPAAAPSTGTADADPFETPEIKAIMDSYGDVIAPVLALMRQQNVQIQSLSSSVSTERAARAAAVEAEAETAEESAVRTRHADYDAIIGNQGFADWAMKHPEFHSAIAINGEKIVNADAVNGLLDRFKADTSWGRTAPAPAGAPADPRRARQLDASRTVPSTSPSAVSANGSDDFSGAFQEAVVKLDREARRR